MIEPIDRFNGVHRTMVNMIIAGKRRKAVAR
jgi:hypothetical protein